MGTIMLRPAKLAIAASVTAMAAVPAFAADFKLPHLPPPPPHFAPEPVPEPPPAVSGWYLRGDISYDVFKKPKVTFNELVHEVEFTKTKIDDTWNIGFGFGHQFNDWFRADLTLDYHHKTKFTGRTDGDCPFGIGQCFSKDTADLTLFTTMANVYADLGYFHGITPYVGAGAGLAYVDWSNVQSDYFCADFCPGFEEFTTTWWSNSQWRFAWALMAGVSVDLKQQLALRGRLVIPVGTEARDQTLPKRSA
jgi:opacity protein-like surface antigen